MKKYLLALATATLLSTSLSYSKSPEKIAEKNVEKTFKVFKKSSTSNDKKLNAIMLLCESFKQLNPSVHPILAIRAGLSSALKVANSKEKGIIQSIINFIENMPLYKEQVQLLYLQGYQLKM